MAGGIGITPILPMMRAAERLGFRFEGVFRQATIYKGRNRDTAWYAITDGLRRQTDLVRGIIERTRADLTLSLREQRLQQSLQDFENRFNGHAKG